MKPHITLFRIPVRFHPSFLFLSLVFGSVIMSGLKAGTALALVVVLVPLVTFAILLHELGHALTGRAFGLQPFIVLHGMGGATIFPAREHRALSHGRRILITLAGPLAGIVVGLAVRLVMGSGHLPPNQLLFEVLGLLEFTTLWWGVLNLIPMLPLDGGHIVLTVLDRIFGARALPFARIGSMVLAGILVALVLLTSAEHDQWFTLTTLFILSSLAFNNFRAYQLERRWQRDEPLEDALKEAFRLLEAGDTARVHKLAQAIRERAATPKTKARVAHLSAWAFLIDGDAESARGALTSAPPDHRPDALLEGSVLVACGRGSEAIGPLIEALIDRREDEVADVLARAVAGAGRLDELIGLLESSERSTRVGAPPLERVAPRLFEQGELAIAGELYERIFERFGDANDAFNAACAAMRLHDEGRALRLLERAVDAKLADPTILDTDEDIAPLRGTPEMDSLRHRAGL